MKMGDINFNDRSDVQRVLAELHQHYIGRPVNNLFMLETLTTEVLNDERMDPATAMSIVVYALKQLALVQDDIKKRVFKYFLGIIKNEKMKRLDAIEKGKKQVEMDRALKDRKVEDEIRKREFAALAEKVGKLYKENLKHFTSVEKKFISNMIADRQFEKAEANINKILAEQVKN